MTIEEQNKKELARLSESQLQIMELCEKFGDWWWSEYVSQSPPKIGPVGIRTLTSPTMKSNKNFRVADMALPLGVGNHLLPPLWFEPEA